MNTAKFSWILTEFTGRKGSILREKKIVHLFYIKGSPLVKVTRTQKLWKLLWFCFLWNAASKSWLNIPSPDLLHFTFTKHWEFYWITQFSEMSKFWTVHNSECCSGNKLSIKKIQTASKEVQNSSYKKNELQQDLRV